MRRRHAIRILFVCYCSMAPPPCLSGSFRMRRAYYNQDRGTVSLCRVRMAATPRHTALGRARTAIVGRRSRRDQSEEGGRINTQQEPRSR